MQNENILNMTNAPQQVFRGPTREPMTQINGALGEEDDMFLNTQTVNSKSHHQTVSANVDMASLAKPNNAYAQNHQ